jgi:hypothetical protein
VRWSPAGSATTPRSSAGRRAARPPASSSSSATPEFEDLAQGPAVVGPPSHCASRPPGADLHAAAPRSARAAARGDDEQVVAVRGRYAARARGLALADHHRHRGTRGSRSSPTSTPCIFDTGLIVTCSRSAATRSSGAASTSSDRGSSAGRPEHDWPPTAASGRSAACRSPPSRRRCRTAARRRRPLGQRDRGQHDRHRAAQAGPREMNASSRQGIGCTTALTSTESGRATKVSTRPATMASPTVSQVIRPGESSRPSITNSPICASQATPSANDRVAARCGQLGVAEHQRGDVHRGEAGRVHGGAAAVREEAEGQHGERVEARTTAGRPGASARRRRSRRAARSADTDDQLEDDEPTWPGGRGRPPRRSRSA